MMKNGLMRNSITSIKLLPKNINKLKFIKVFLSFLFFSGAKYWSTNNWQIETNFQKFTENSTLICYQSGCLKCISNVMHYHML